MPTLNPLPLNYWPRSPWYRRRHIRRIAFTIFALAFLAASYAWGPALWLHAKILYWQHQCLTYTLPPDQVVYEPDPKRAARLLTQNGSQYVASNAPPTSAQLRPPNCLQQLSGLRPAPPGPWNLPSSPCPIPGFMHELYNHKGQKRLVIVEPPTDPGWFSYYVYELIPISHPWRPIPTSMPWVSSCYANSDLFGFEHCQFRIFAGQTDPADPSHFTFAYENEKGKGTIDGWLTDTCDIQMKVRDGPATAPPVPAPVQIQSDVKIDPAPSNPHQNIQPGDLIDDRNGSLSGKKP